MGEGGVLGEGEAWVSIARCNPTMTVINAMLSDGAPCEDGERLMLSERDRSDFYTDMRRVTGCEAS